MPFRVSRGVRSAAALLAVAALGACADDPELNLVAPANNAAFMQRYVAIGNSITAGYQSGGIDEATQRQSYARLLADAAGTTYQAAYVTGPGCAPYTDPINAFLGATGGATNRVVPPNAVACARTSASAGATLLTNVAVPGANSADPINAAGASPNPLTTLILGGRTQVERALELDPTFVSVWIGNNDALGAALRGDTTLATPAATFQQRYDAMIAQLTAGGAGAERRGALIGVVDVTNVPALFPAAVLVSNAGGFRTAIEQGFLGGRPLAIVGPTCPANTSALVSLGLVLQLAQAARTLPAGQPIPFACAPFTVPGTMTVVGTGGVVDAAERTALSARVAAYNGIIRGHAERLGWAYLDPNTLLQALRAEGRITPVPVLAGPQAATAPFGSAVSLDGIHPSAEAHRRVAVELIGAINARYGSTIPTTLPTAATATR